MRLLLDTNVFIWLNDSPRRISDKVMSIVANPDNDLFLSLTSIWEMQAPLPRTSVTAEIAYIKYDDYLRYATRTMVCYYCYGSITSGRLHQRSLMVIDRVAYRR